VIVSGFFSASETSLFSLSRFQLRQLKQKNPDKFARVRYLLDRPAALVATVLLGNELANVLISNLLASFYESQRLPPIWVTLFNLITVIPIIMILGEITPKIVAAKANLTVSQLVVTPLWLFYRISFPVRFLIENSVELLTRPVRRRQPAKDDHIREEDIRILLDEGKKKGAIHSLEQDIIENVFEIDDDKVADLATPIADCFTVHQDNTPSEVIDRLKRNFYARVPVLGEQPSQVVGILYAKDLLNFINRDDQEMKVRSLMKEPLFVEPTMKVEVLFRRFRQLKRHIAIIADKQGQSVAMITMEDILDQMFGELWEDHK
jgi:putative hemolysin